MIKDRDRKYIEAIIAKYENSIFARIEKLTAEQREGYALYCWRLSRWETNTKAECPRDYENPDEWLYVRALAGYGPNLREDIETALFGNAVQILETDSELVIQQRRRY
ncbi:MULTISPECIES: hypothetical protein [unclassified Nitrobacter]|uniref:hypothetical protein n=1 Tax=unclassified Nitrobacter TaxID=2620411 RepID=UPI00092958DF|nr:MULTISPECIES: hypothetical protein [unclassified Nitrobacter]MBN9147179.1 hypothetical protein [Nitrobacter sp.]OJV02324.1 MAG: hypothetical protein BGO16_01875 [Nitrobacter sp. 62-23]